MCFVKIKQSFGFFSFAHFLKLIIAARQRSTEICNACRYWSMLVVYRVDIIRLNNFTIEICGFYCGACHCFYRYTDVFQLRFFIIYRSVIFYECICFYLTVSESDIIKLFNQSIYKESGISIMLESYSISNYSAGWRFISLQDKIICKVHRLMYNIIHL